MRNIKKRPIAAVLALLGACDISAALADPPVAGPSAATVEAKDASATSATTATSATSATSAAAESQAALEKRLTNSGYRPRMRNGTKVWCRRETELGTRLGAQEVCGTPEELKMVVQQNQDAVKDIQKARQATMGN